MNSLNIKITFLNLMKFVMPTTLMMLFLSIYTMIDGIFVSHYVNTSALSAVNIVYPVVNVIIAIATMLGSGGNAVVAKELGEGKFELAKAHFTMIVIFGFILGLVISTLCIIFIEPLIIFLGSEDVRSIYTYCYDYGIYLIAFMPLCMLQASFHTFFVTSGNPGLGLYSTIIGGIFNIVFDYILIVELDMGVAGASIATGLSYLIPAVIGIFYFFTSKKSLITFVKPAKDFKTLLKTCSNGSSEMISNLSSGVTLFLFNITTMKLMGENGVAAITIILYAQFLLNASFIGYSTGIAPLVSFNFGNNNEENVKKIFKYSLIFIVLGSIFSFYFANISAKYIISLFSKDNVEVMNISINGMKIFSFAFIFMGLNIFTSALFTAFSNGKISAILSFIRTFLLISTFIILLPYFYKENGIWLAVPLAEAISICISITLLYKYKKNYKY